MFIFHDEDENCFRFLIHLVELIRCNSCCGILLSMFRNCTEYSVLPYEAHDVYAPELIAFVIMQLRYFAAGGEIFSVRHCDVDSG